MKPASRDEFSLSVQSAWKYVAQLRVQHQKNKASLVLGAGISWDLQLPLWGVLVNNIKERISAKAPQAALVNEAPGKAALILFEMFYEYRRAELMNEAEYRTPSVLERKILSDWRAIIHDSLYCKTDIDKRRNVIDSHPYFAEMIAFIKNSELTVNYNFDDYIEYGLSQPDLNETSNERPYQTVWSHHSQFTKDKRVIYHPNGFLPFDRSKFQSEHLIFSDGAFADQLLDGIGGGLSTLLHVLTKKTSILLGHSLTDSTLLHLLRKSASISPGNYNYFIRYMADDEHIDDSSKRAIFEANFSNYNLITLFFKNEDIRGFIKAITMPDQDFDRESNILGLETKYCYYLVGALGVGKSTLISQFGNLVTLDEWFDERPPEMSRAPDEISEPTTRTIDEWTNSQFRKKNDYLLSKKTGIYLIDRSPIDPLTFAVEVPVATRAKSMISEGIRPFYSKNKVVNGVIIHLIGDPKEIWSRLIVKRKENSWPEQKIKDLQDLSLRLYKPLHPHIVLSTGRRDVDIVREVAKIIFSPNYTPSDLDRRLMDTANGQA